MTPLVKRGPRASRTGPRVRAQKVARSSPKSGIVPAHVAVAGLNRGGKRIAVFLGAGASAPFGYPITRELLKKIVCSLDRGTSGFLKTLAGDPSDTGRHNRDLLSQYLSALLPGESVPRQNLPLVTTLLSLLDYSLSVGQSVLPSQSAERTRQARRLLERGILEAIDDGKEFDRHALELLRRFSWFLAAMRRRSGGAPLPIVTTNYDLAADEATYMSANIPGARFWNEDVIAKRIDFGFPWLHPDTPSPRLYRRPNAPAFQLLKLHGSTNWLRCPLCDNVYIDPWGPIWDQAYKTQPDVHSTCHCSDTQLEAQIVSPSFVRDVRAANLLSVWKTALDCLRAADEWIIIGYSFPDEDLAIRALFTRAYGSRQRRPRLTVVQKDESSFPRFEAFFERERLAFCSTGLEEFLRGWQASLSPAQVRRLMVGRHPPKRRRWVG